MKTWIVSVLLILSQGFTIAWAQETQPQTGKHPRVLEVEKSLSREGMEFLRARFPGRPFIVSAVVDPLHRIKKAGENEQSSNLPYYSMSEEEIFDEWDDPAIPVVALLGRVKKISLILTVPSDLSEDELTEIKASIVPNLGLLEARDNVEVRKRTWLNQPTTEQMSWWNVFAYGGMLVGFLVGLFGIASFASTKLSKAMREAGPGKSSGDSAPVINLPSAPVIEGFAGPGSSSGGGFGGTSDVRMLDSLKFREHVSTALKMLQDHKDFPRLEDMLVFEQFASKNSGEFGAFLAEMPHDLRLRVFSLSHSVPWLAAMTEPTDVGAFTLEMMQKCLRIQRNAVDAEWQHFLITVWRLQAQSEKFFQGIPQADAMTILAHLPKGDGVKWGRQMFPGNWGQLLDPSFSPKPLNELQIQKYMQKALSILPMRKSDVLLTYQSEKEVINFVRVANVQTEKEVYMAAGEHSTLKEVRPPFFPFFELNPEQCQKLFRKLSIEEWATALFNTPKPDRASFESILNPKQKLRIYEVFRKLEQKQPLPHTVASIRERVGRNMAELHLEESTGSAAQDAAQKPELVKAA